MKNIFSSPRFWLIVIIAVIQSLAVFNVVGGVQADQLINIISLALGGMIALRTVDRNTGDAAVKAAEVTGAVTTVTIPAGVSNVSASTE